jgi:site-specific DNA recombinase
MFTNPVYYGVIEFKGELYEGKHAPIITKVLFDKVQDARKRKSKSRTPTLKPYLYRGFLRCGECGCWVTTETQKGHNYLHCTKRVKRDCTQKYLREDAFALQLDRWLERLTLRAGDADWMLAELEKERNQDDVAGLAATEVIRRRIKADDERLERLMHAYLDNALSLKEYRDQKARIINDRKQKEEDLAELERHRSGWFEPAIGFVNELKTAENLASSDDAAEKLEFVKKTGSNFRLLNRELICDPRGAWQLVVDQGSFAQHNAAPAIASAAFFGETHHDLLKRRRRDSNSRDPCGPTGFQDRRNRPLCHSSRDFTSVYSWAAGASK